MDCFYGSNQIYIKKYFVPGNKVDLSQKQSIHSDASHPHWVFHTSDKICLNMPCVSLARCVGRDVVAELEFR